MVNTSDFDGKPLPLVVGSIYGERSWDVVPETGKLESVSADFHWNSGENVAKCNCPESVTYTWGEVRTALFNYLPKDAAIDSIDYHEYDNGWGPQISYTDFDLKFNLPTDTDFIQKIMFGGEIFTSFENDRWHFKQTFNLQAFIETFGQKREPEPHSLDGCTCGFYAFYRSSSNSYLSNNRVTGIIEGYGETIIGSLGFRAAKAKIVALYIPLKVESRGWGRGFGDSEGFDEDVFRKITNSYPDAELFYDYHRMTMSHPASNAGDFTWNDVA